MSKILKIMSIALLLAMTLTVGVLAGSLMGNIARAQGPIGRPFSGMMGGMMGGWGSRWFGVSPSTGITGTVPYGYGSGICPMHGGWGYTGTGTPISLDQAVDAARRYTAAYNNQDLILDEVMEFTNNFYFIVKEKSTGNGAFELLVDRYTGYVHPEPGPNMMWNTKYGHMGGFYMMGGWGNTYGRQPTAQMPVTVEQARQKAQAYLNGVLPGATLDEGLTTFYGYYTIDVLKDGKVFGMLSVNGYSGQVWYHTWHGDFIQEKELGQ